MSIFKNLLLLNPNKIPAEDFFTEIFAYLLKSDSNLLLKFVQEYNIPCIDNAIGSISTQVSFDALEYHLSGSIPDIFIELSNQKERELIFIESKIGSTEGYHQLQRYAEHLDNMKPLNKGVLIYITRDFDKKHQATIFQNCHNKEILHFFQLRWHEVYHFLKAYHNNINCELIDETLKFMEEYGLTNDNRFTSIDILAMTNFSHVRRMMNETMFGIVSDKYKEVAGGVSQESTALTQLRNHGRYTLIQFQKTDFEILLGYWLDSSNMIDFPRVGVRIGAGPNAHHIEDIKRSMKDIEHNEPKKWVTYGFDQSRAWVGIAQERGIDKFLAEEDHIKAIQDYFLMLLSEINEIKNKYPDLPWNINSFK